MMWKKIGFLKSGMNEENRYAGLGLL